MAQITFSKQAAGRADNPWLTTALDVRGADADTLRAHASAALYETPLLACENTRGMPSAERWIAFQVENQTFEARFLARGFTVEVRLPA